MLASKHIIGLHRDLILGDLNKRNCFDDQSIEKVLEEWYYIALCLDRAPKAEDDLSHAALLEELRLPYALVRELPEDATWNEIIVKAMSEFDEPIQAGIECNWPWEKVFQLYRASQHIDCALRYGADPDVSPERLLEIMRQRIETCKREIASKQEELDKALGEIREIWGLPEGTTLDQAKEVIFTKLRAHLGQLWNRTPDQISDEEITDFLKNQD
jgi:hypothetical protein